MLQLETIREVIIAQVLIEVVMEEAEITGHIVIIVGMNVENVAEQTTEL